MKPNKTIVIFNPAANRNHAQAMEETLKGFIKSQKNVDWEKTSKPGDAKFISVNAIEDGCNRIVSIGGDGTTAEVVNGMMSFPKPKRPVLGIVPIGSGNDFAGGLGISMKPQASLQEALEGKGKPIDIGKLKANSGNEYFWVNVVGIGFDAVVDIHTRSMPFFSGFWLYLASALKTIMLNHKPYHFTGEMDGKVFARKLLMLIISNGKREGGGFKIAPLAKLNDGFLNFVGVGEISRLRMLMTLPYFLQGTQDKLPYVESGSLKNMQISADRPMQIHADGEILAGLNSTVTKLNIEILPGAVNISH
jgi:diacylglycerol kinase (ATP)